MPFVGDGGRELTGDLRSRSKVGGSSFGASINVEVGRDLTLREPVSEALVVFEYLLALQAALPLTELAREGEFERVSSGRGLVGLSDSTVDSCDMPGNLVLPDAGGASTVRFSWLFLYAAEPMPLSAVCLNQEGSLEPNASAICALDGSCPSSAVFGSGVPRGLLAAFSAASIDSGLRPLLDFGRCCHERVPERERVLVAGDAGVSSDIFFASMVWEEGEEMSAGELLTTPAVLGAAGLFSGERERERSGEAEGQRVSAQSWRHS